MALVLRLSILMTPIRHHGDWHAYGHEWPCQLVYNPCLVPGLGLSDGEGTERLWSRLVTFQ